MTTNIDLTLCETAHLLAELHRREAFARLHHAVGALHDHLSNSGAMDGETPLTPYLVYRMRGEVTAVSGAPDARKTTMFWNEKIASLG